MSHVLVVSLFSTCGTYTTCNYCILVKDTLCNQHCSFKTNVTDCNDTRLNWKIYQIAEKLLKFALNTKQPFNKPNRCGPVSIFSLFNIVNKLPVIIALIATTGIISVRFQSYFAGHHLIWLRIYMVLVISFQ